MQFRSIPLTNIGSDTRSQQRVVHTIDHYINRLEEIKPDIAEQFKLLDKSGQQGDWELESIGVGSSLLIPNSKEFVSFLRRVNIQHDLLIPAAFITSEPNSKDDLSKNISDTIDNAISGTDKEQSMEKLKTNDPEEMINTMEIIREKALILAEKQKTLIHEAEMICVEYQQTGDETLLSQIQGINHELMELKLEQTALTELTEELVGHIENEPTLQDELVLSQVEFTTDAVEQNTLPAQSNDKFIVNINELRNEFNSKQMQSERQPAYVPEPEKIPAPKGNKDLGNEDPAFSF